MILIFFELLQTLALYQQWFLVDSPYSESAISGDFVHHTLIR
ncbi:hypothetical protein RCG17_00905 [Neobacillus sp. PS3-12]|nr:hypothetical protein [Neobacillus sp. PS3-12]WML53301.1 hypothetical protein RCG17_00905 [Neobacillus sp. PS3-12]